MHISSDDQSDSLATHCTLEMAMEREILSHTKSWCFYMFYVSLKKRCSRPIYFLLQNAIVKACYINQLSSAQGHPINGLQPGEIRSLRRHHVGGDLHLLGHRPARPGSSPGLVLAKRLS